MNVTDAVQQAARIMVDKQLHRLIVVEGGMPVGILTTFDIARLNTDSEG